MLDKSSICWQCVSNLFAIGLSSVRYPSAIPYLRSNPFAILSGFPTLDPFQFGIHSGYEHFVTRFYALLIRFLLRVPYRENY